MADQQPRSRQELYEMIRSTSKQEFILTEMKRLGFWNTEDGLPKLSEELIKKGGELDRELQGLLKKKRAWDNKEKLLKEMRKKRMEDAKLKREETKIRQEKKRVDKATAWEEKKKTDIIYLGKEHSKGLNNKDNNADKLNALELPVFDDITALAEAMKITIGQLRYLSYSRKVSTSSHYKRFTIPKKSGGVRTISSPMMYLKNAQHWILENILYKLNIHEKAHGFVPKKSILTNAQPHIGKEFIINIDLKNFFPTITYKRVKGVFRGMGYSEQMSTIFALLCTEPEIDEVMMDGDKYYVAKGERFLPQGAPTSPAITNIICHKMDKRMVGTADKLGFTYSRYADDMTFSKQEADDEKLKRLMWQVKMIVADENFTIHPKKIHIMRKGAKKEVTGIVVNEKLSVPRKKLKNFRAVLHKIEKTKNLEGINWGTGSPLNSIYGFANFIRMVDPEKGGKIMAKVQLLMNDPKVKASAATLIPVKQEKEEAKTTASASKTNNVQKSENDSDSDWWSIW
jgi:RNA-directed DNA polymerase